ncbi:MAG TPA: hypothetical protein VF916_02790 [Ktedonobacterales bacterium]
MTAAVATQPYDHADEYQRALERAVKVGVVVLERGTLPDGTPFVATTSASHPGQAHLVRAYPGGRVTCDCAAPSARLCMHRALASAEWAGDEAERTGDEWTWRPTPKGRALAIGEEIAARAAWAREEYWAEVWASLDEGR